MNLKNACTITLVMTLAAIMLTASGYVIFYATLLTEHFHMSNLSNAVISILTFLLQAGGLIVLLLAVRTRLKDPDANAKTLFILAGVLILLGVLIGTGMNLTHAVGMYRHFPPARYLYYMTLWLFVFLAGAALAGFAITSSARTPGALALAADGHD